jgi:hypothetical protein
MAASYLTANGTSSQSPTASVAELVDGRSRRRGQQGGAICEVLVRGPRC